MVKKILFLTAILLFSAVVFGNECTDNGGTCDTSCSVPKTQDIRGLTCDAEAVCCSVPQCYYIDTLGDTTFETVFTGPADGANLYSVLNNNGYDASKYFTAPAPPSEIICDNCDTDQFQTNYTANHFSSLASTTTLIGTANYLSKNGDSDFVFGYYFNENKSTFQPLFKSGSMSGTSYESVPEESIGSMVPFSINASEKDSFGFAIYTKKPVEGSLLFYAEKNSLNIGTYDQVLTLD
ncbi:MAG: hypothetical protein NUV57_00245, partial [archaeon]|nr:hypothetical protein [archaeon]